MHLRRTFVLLTILLTTAANAPFASAQIAADLRGRVLDPSGAAVANAPVALIDTATNLHRGTISSTSGDYVFTHLTPGIYRIETSAPTFNPLVRSNITIALGGTTTVDLSLQLGTGRETVEVAADAPLLQAQTSNIQTNISGSIVVAMPLNSRNFIQLATLAPGVALPPGTVLPRINGGRPRTNEYLYDGISALQPEPGQVAFFPILDSIQEFTVEANNVPAEFGRFNGGVVNVATRSGSNAIHGSLFEFFRNEKLNSRNYFSKAPAAKPEYRRNLYGATFGAPIIRNRLFFFGDYQGVKQLIGITRISTIPTAAQRQGIFSGVAHVFDPASTQTVAGRFVRTEFPNDVITSGLDPAAQALLARLPAPTSSATANNYTRTANDADHQNQFDVRIDANRTSDSKDRAFARYTYYNEVEQPVTPLPDGSGAISGSVIGTGGVAGLSIVLGQQAVLNQTHTFTAHLLNDLRVGYTRRSNNILGTALSATASNALGIPGIPTNAAFNNALPLFTITGLQQLGPSASTFSQYQTGVWQFIDTVVYNRGRHSFKVGFDGRWYQLNAVAPPNPTGSFAFTTTGSNQQGLVIAPTDRSTNGNAFASFLLGQVDTFSIDLQTSILRPRDHIEEYFVQDDWKLSDRLTANIGVRYTLHFPSTEKTNQGAVFNLATQQLDYLGPQPSQSGNSKSARQLHYGNFAPRVGFTYLLTPKTVVRSGFGIVFIDQSGITTPFTTPQFPYIQNVQQKTQDSINAAFKLSAGPTVAPIALTPNAGLGQSVYTANRTAGSGYVEQWNLALQRAITNNLSVDVAYVGSHIVHVGIPDSNLNQLTAAQLAQGLTNPTSLTAQVANPYFGTVPASSPLGGKTVAAGQLLKPYPRFQNVATYRNNTGTTNYNAFQAKLEQRLSHGVSLLLSYTHSKLTDDASSVFSSTVLSSPNSSSLIAADAFTPRLERDSSNGDMPNVLSFSGMYQIPGAPFLRLRGAPFVGSFTANGWGPILYAADKLLGGWSLNTILSLQSGMPVTITQATNNNAFAGVALQRPNQIATPSLNPADRTPARFFNTAAFATAPTFTFGNASRNPVRGPAYRDLDVALVKRTTLYRETALEFRAEIFDITNTPAFGQPNGSFGSAAFGSITTTTTDPRVVQFALKLSR